MNGERGLTRVLVAEDSATTRAYLVSVLEADRGVEVVAAAEDGAEAVELVKALQPDVVVMDILMPRKNGFEATEAIMRDAPTPIVMVSANLDVQEAEIAARALRAGAVSVMPKPDRPNRGDFDWACRQFVETVKAMGQVKVRRRAGHRAAPVCHTPATPATPANVPRRATPMRIVAMAASTGGPTALSHILSKLPANFPAPILVVQLLTRGFVGRLARSFDAASPLKVKVAEDGEPLLPGTVYLAPEDRHLGVLSEDAIEVSDDEPIGGLRPSGTFLFRSVARIFAEGTTAVLLSGTGSDGLAGLRAVHEAGGLVVAQDEESSVAFETARAARQANLVDTVLPLAEIPGALTAVTRLAPVPLVARPPLRKEDIHGPEEAAATLASDLPH